MTQLHPLRALRDMIGDMNTAINAAREYHRAGAARRADERSDNSLTAGIPL